MRGEGALARGADACQLACIQHAHADVLVQLHQARGWMGGEDVRSQHNSWCVTGAAATAWRGGGARGQAMPQFPTVTAQEDEQALCAWMHHNLAWSPLTPSCSS